MIGLSWTLGIVGSVLLFSGSALFRNLVSEPAGGVARLPLWSRLLIILVVLAAGGVVFGYWLPLRIRGKRHRATIITSFDQLRDQRYVLYLRPFALDPGLALPPPDAPGWLFRSPFELPGLTVEQFLVRQFAHLGPVVAIGRPGEQLPPLGARRGYLPVDDWRPTVGELIQGAHIVVMFAAPGPGTVWEFTEAVRRVAPTRLVMLSYGEPAHYDAFCAAAAQEYATRSATEAAAAGGWPPLPPLPDLPAPPAHPKGLRWSLPLHGIVTFDQDWRANFTRFDPTVPRVRGVWTLRRLVRRRLAPALAGLARLPTSHPSMAARKPAT